MTAPFRIAPIGHVRGSRAAAVDDAWGGAECAIELAEGIPDEALLGLDAFSHAEILYVFDRVDDAEIELGARHPRGNRAWPRVGILAQRGKGRPNRLGATIVPIVRVDGRRLVVLELDAIEGTPVVDIKPMMREFLPRTPVVQPEWATELMAGYWSKG